MRTEKEILIESIVCDRLPLNYSVLNLVFFLMSGGQMPPIKVQKCETGYKLLDGRHRVAAYKLLGLKKIWAKFYDTDTDTDQFLVNAYAIAVLLNISINEAVELIKHYK